MTEFLGPGGEQTPFHRRMDKKGAARDHASLSRTFIKVCVDSSHLLTVSVERTFLSFKHKFI